MNSNNDYNDIDICGGVELPEQFRRDNSADIIKHLMREIGSIENTLKNLIKDVQLQDVWNDWNLQSGDLETKYEKIRALARKAGWQEPSEDEDFNNYNYSLKMFVAKKLNESLSLSIKELQPAKEEFIIPDAHIRVDGTREGLEKSIKNSLIKNKD